MKIRPIITLCILFCTAIVLAQAPQKMSYQSVVRDAAGNLVTSSPVGIKVSILQGSVSGTPVYVETHNPATNGNGLATLEIGGGNVQTGSFSSIAWASGPYFVKIDIDPSGGSSYTISSTSQFLSVPYALYAENTRPQGRATIYLTGDITDAEAAAKIAAEAGPNTENIYIVDTTVLSNVSFSGLTSLMNLKIAGNPALQAVTLNDVKTINDIFRVTNNANLATLSFPDLEMISGSDLNIGMCPLLSLSMPSLTEIISSNMLITLASSLNLPALQSLKFTGTQFTAQPYLIVPALSCPSLTYISKATLVASDISLPALQNAGYLIISGQGAQINISSLTTGHLSITNSLLTSLTLPSFTSGTLEINSNAQLTSVTFPNLVTLKADDPNHVGSAIRSNPNLTSISFPMLSNLDNSQAPFPSLFLYGNKLPSSAVNAILHQMLTVTPLKGLDLRQTPAAPPTGQGIIDKQTLISQGNNILTD